MIHYSYEIVKRKKVILYWAADQEFIELPRRVSTKFKYIFTKIERDGQLREPDGKKLGNTRLFEIRVRVQGQWRAIYAYYVEDSIIILRIFQKKTQKTPIKEIDIALKRLSSL